MKQLTDKEFFEVIQIRDNRAQSNKWLNDWERLGLKNDWISEAHDPVFEKGCILICNTEEELIENLSHGNWCLGQGFALGDICFINQIDGGDEYLVIKQNVAFESFSPQLMIRDGSFLRHLHGIQNSTLEQCASFDYLQGERL